jgi:hypothetical protein
MYQFKRYAETALDAHEEASYNQDTHLRLPLELTNEQCRLHEPILIALLLV